MKKMVLRQLKQHLYFPIYFLRDLVFFSLPKDKSRVAWRLEVVKAAEQEKWMWEKDKKDIRCQQNKALFI